jgi:acyl carrier protein
LRDDGEIERALREHVVTGYAGGADVDAEDDLLASGIVDSMGVMEIIGFLEERFPVVVDDEDIVPENFRSLRTMTEYVARKRTADVTETSAPSG